MAPLIDFPARREIGAFSRPVDEESDRLCAVIANARSSEEREHALAELKRLAINVLACIEALHEESADIQLSTAA